MGHQINPRENSVKTVLAQEDCATYFNRQPLIAANFKRLAGDSLDKVHRIHGFPFHLQITIFLAVHSPHDSF